MCLGHQFLSRFFQQHSRLWFYCAVALLVELWFPSVILLFILTFNVFFRFVKTYIVQMQLDFSYRQFTLIFWKLQLSNAMPLFILKLGAYLTLRARLTYFGMHICCILFWILVHFRVTCGILSGYFWYSLWLQYMFVLHIVLYCFVAITTHILFPIYILEALTHILAQVF